MNRAASGARSIGAAAALFAASVGIGRFVYTPILPLMIDQAGLSREAGGWVATTNYAGNFAGALLGSLFPVLLRSQAWLRVALVVLVVTLALMPVTGELLVWCVLRFIAGVVAALAFMYAVDSTLSGPAPAARGADRWAFAGVGAGIVVSGLVVLAVSGLGGGPAAWEEAWWAAAILLALLAAASWNLAPGSDRDVQPDRPTRRRSAWFWVLFAAYSLEGVGYIIAGTFLVAAASATLPAAVAGGSWVLVGVAALPSSLIWAALARRITAGTLLVAALAAQAVGIAVLPLAGGSVAAAAVSAVLFGATFVAISSLALELGTRVRGSRSVAILTAGYSAGQIVGPAVVFPVLGSGFGAALLLGASVVAAAALAAGIFRIGEPNLPR